MGSRIDKLLLVLLLLQLIAGCAIFRAESKSDTTKQTNTVTKTTEVISGSSEWNHKKTIYTEQVAKEVAHVEQAREYSAPAADGILASLPSTGNPIVDLIIGYFTAKLGIKGGQTAVTTAKSIGGAVARRVRKPKANKEDTDVG